MAEDEKIVGEEVVGEEKEENEFTQVIESTPAEKREEFLNNIVFCVITNGTPSTPPSEEEMSYSAAVITSQLINDSEPKEELKELFERYERNRDLELQELSSLIDSWGENYDLPPIISLPGGVRINLVVRNGDDYRVMQLG